MTVNHLIVCYVSILMCLTFQAYPVFGIFRINEVMLFPVLAFYSWNFLKKSEVIFVVTIIFFIMAIASSIIGVIESEERFVVEELVFYYKYIYLFFALFSTSKLAELIKSTGFEKNFKIIYFISVCFLTGYVIYSVFFVFDPLSAATGSTRVSLMLTDTTGFVSNSPLYSVMLALSFIAIFEGVKLSNDRYVVGKYLLMGVVFVSLMFTGSRSGVLLLTIYGLIILIKRLDWKITLLMFTFGLGVYVLSGIFENNQEFSLYQNLLDRSLNFDLSSDESAQSRTEKQLHALWDSVEAGFLLGVGHENTNIRWYDGALGNLIVFSGLLGALLFYVIIYLYLVKLHRVYGEEFVRFFCVFLFINFVSEYYLTANGVIFFVFSLLYVILAKTRESV